MIVIINPIQDNITQFVCKDIDDRNKLSREFYLRDIPHTTMHESIFVKQSNSSLIIKNVLPKL